MPSGAGLRPPDPRLSGFARDVERALDASHFPYISATPLAAAELTAALAARHPFRKALVRDGAGNRYEAISNGAAFYYMDGSAV